MATIKGVSTEEVLTKIKEPRKPDGDLGKFPYYSSTMYYERVEELIGVGNYTFEIIPGSRVYTVIKDGQEMITVSARLTIYDDNHNIVTVVDGTGSSEIQYAKETQKCGGLKNIDKIALTNAFKDCWDRLGLFGKAFKLDSERPAASSRNLSRESKEAATKDVVSIVISTGGSNKPQIVSNDKQSGKPIYKVQGYLCDGNEKTNELIEVIFYPNQYGKCLDKFNRLIVSLETQAYKVPIKGSYGSKGGFIFKSF